MPACPRRGAASLSQCQGAPGKLLSGGLGAVGGRKAQVLPGSRGSGEQGGRGGPLLHTCFPYVHGVWAGVGVCAYGAQWAGAVVPGPCGRTWCVSQVGIEGWLSRVLSACARARVCVCVCICVCALQRECAHQMMTSAAVWREKLRLGTDCGLQLPSNH